MGIDHHLTGDRALGTEMWGPQWRATGSDRQSWNKTWLPQTGPQDLCTTSPAGTHHMYDNGGYSHLPLKLSC